MQRDEMPKSHIEMLNLEESHRVMMLMSKFSRTETVWITARREQYCTE
jgi:hypothetical protein